MKLEVRKALPARPAEETDARMELTRDAFAELIREAREANTVSGETTDINSDPGTNAVAADHGASSLKEIPKHELVKYFIAWAAHNQRIPRVPILNESLLTTAVAGFEVFVANAVTAFYHLCPDALKADETKYSLADIEGFETLGEFRESCIERVSEGLLHGGLDDWMTWFDQRSQITLPDISRDPARLREVFQRRNMMIHNSGVVRRQYLKKVRGISPLPALGDKLKVDSVYLHEATDLLAVAAVNIAAAIARSLIKSTEDSHPSDSLVSNAAYGALKDGRYEATIALTEAGIKTCRSDYLKLIIKVNRLIALKSTGEASLVESEVRAWQVSALTPRFKLAKHALLDELEEAVKLVKAMIERGELSESEWSDWPLLADVRVYTKRLGGSCPVIEGNDSAV